jgi:hypothetical protein
MTGLNRSVLIGASAAVLLLAPLSAHSQQKDKIDVPIMLGGDGDLDACGGLGVIVGLDPKGDGFLSVQSGPGGRPYREIDRLYNGNSVHICGQRGKWLSIVYPANGRDCGISTPWPTRLPYTGPCRYGWVHSRYVRLTAG